MDTENKDLTDPVQKVRDLGGLGYTARQCYNILQPDVNFEVFQNEFNNKESDFRKNYEIGVDLADFKIDTKLLVLAETGDLNALKEYERRKLNHQKYRK